VTGAGPKPGELRDRLQGAASACRHLLESSATERWEVFVKASVTREAEVAGGQLRRTVSIEESGVGVRVYDHGRSGFAAASGLGRSAARAAVEAARAGATRGPDPLPPQRLLGTSQVTPGPELPPRGWSQHVAGELAISLASLSPHLGMGRAIPREGSFAWSLVTAEGWSAVHRRTVASMLVEVLVDDRPGTWREWIHVPDPTDFNAEAVAARIGNRALLTRHRIATDRGLHDLMLHPEVSAGLLSAISPLFRATPTDRDPLPGLLDRGGMLASYPLTVVDDRSDPSAPVVSPCDGEGLPSHRTLLLEKGAPRHRVASYADATRFDELPRGGAVRFSYRDCPTTGIANMKVLTDEGMAAAELLAASDRILYLLRPLAPVVCDLTDDSYSLVASGVWIDRQRVRGWHPVVELRGGLGSLLRRIEAVGTDLGWFETGQGFIGAPSILVRRQPVVG
jgi:PmbA protein